jgi:hypothetical protein
MPVRLRPEGRNPGAELGLRKQVRQAFDRRIITGNARPDRRDGPQDDSNYRYAIARPANATANQQISDRHAATLASPVLTFTLEFVAFL